MRMSKLDQNLMNSAARPNAYTGEYGIALAPPAYGIELADLQLEQAADAAIQRRAAPATIRDAAPGIPQPNRTGLPDALKSGIEALYGRALNDVRVRFNSSRPAQLQALAYTQGREIHVAPGQERHLPHEAWHVVQQRQGRVRTTRQLAGAQINDDAGLEHEANVMGGRAIQLKGGGKANLHFLSTEKNTPASQHATTLPRVWSGAKTIVNSQPIQAMKRTHLDDERPSPGAMVPSSSTVYEHTRLRITYFIYILAKTVKMVQGSKGNITPNLFYNSAEAQTQSGFRLGSTKESRQDAAHLIRPTLNDSEVMKQRHLLIRSNSIEELYKAASATTNQWQTTNLGPDKVIDQIQTDLKNKFLASTTLGPIDKKTVRMWLQEYIGEVKAKISAKLPEKTALGVDPLVAEVWTTAHQAILDCEKKLDVLEQDIAKDLGLE